MGFLDSSYIRTVVVMSPGGKIIFCFLNDTQRSISTFVSGYPGWHLFSPNAQPKYSVTEVKEEQKRMRRNFIF